MPTKNWLIRTKSNHILGPVSKEKVIELYHNGSVRLEDEICCGNGFWFFLREKEQVEAYLLGDRRQSFNPISEAIDVLTASAENKNRERQVDEDITLIGGINLNSLKDEVPEVPVRPVKPEPIATAPEINLSHEQTSTQIVRPSVRLSVVPSVPTPVSPGKIKKKTLSPVSHVPLPAPPRARMISDRSLMVGTIVILIILAGLLYYRKRLLKEFIHGATSIVLPYAHAQGPDLESKKKIFLRPLALQSSTPFN